MDPLEVKAILARPIGLMLIFHLFLAIKAAPRVEINTQEQIIFGRYSNGEKSTNQFRNLSDQEAPEEYENVVFVKAPRAVQKVPRSDVDSEGVLNSADQRSATPRAGSSEPLVEPDIEGE